MLARGLISGHWTAGAASAGDSRAYGPRFQSGAVEHNLALVEALRSIAQSKGASVAQLAIAWVAERGPDIIPLIGARRRDRLDEALGSLSVHFTAYDIAAIERAAPRGAALGDRYPSAVLAHMDSEQG